MIMSFIFKNQIVIGMILALPFFLPWENKRSFFWLRFSLSVVGLVCLSNFCPIPGPWNLLTYFVALGVIVGVCFNCRLDHIFFSVTCAYCVQHIASKLTYLFVNILFRKGFIPFQFYVAVVLVGLLLIHILLCIPVYFYFTKTMLRRENLCFDSAKTIVSSVLFLFIAVFISYYMERGLDFRSQTYLSSYCGLNLFCSLFALLILMINFMNCGTKKLEQEKEKLEQLLKKDELQYEQARINMERINIRYHDLKYRRNQTEIELSQEEEAIVCHKYYTGNKAVDIALTEKAELCTQTGIQFICSADGACLDRLKPYHIYSLLGNAIDNAIESLKKLSDADRDKKVLRFEIYKHGEMSVIRVENYVSAKVALKNGLPQTSKEDKENHGFGVKSIKNIAEEYDGNIYINSDNNLFTLFVAFPTHEGKKSPPENKDAKISE